MADYKVTDTELTSIANAIRTKGGTQAQLEFPTGFVSAVQAIPTGGGEQKIAEWDFTSETPLVDIINGITATDYNSPLIDGTGLCIDESNQYVKILDYLAARERLFTMETGTMNLSTTPTVGYLLKLAANVGIVWRLSKWQLQYASNGYEEIGFTSYDDFKNSKIGIMCTFNGYIKIFKDETLIFTSQHTVSFMGATTPTLFIGNNSSSAIGYRIKKYTVSK